jgi:acyl-CoA thioester hydrolase
MYIYCHKIQFYETDLMGIVHHSNYLRFCEEARVSYAIHKGLLDYQKPESAAQFAVWETRVKHLGPLRFGDDVQIEIRARVEMVRVVFQYRMKVNGQVCCVAQTEHVALDTKLKLQRLPENFIAAWRDEKWTETWL